MYIPANLHCYPNLSIPHHCKQQQCGNQITNVGNIDDIGNAGNGGGVIALILPPCPLKGSSHN